MACYDIAQFARAGVENAAKDGDEHALVVVAGEFGVHVGEHVAWVAMGRGGNAEQGLGDGHEEGLGINSGDNQ